VYIDTSVYNRPFDDQGQARIWLETVTFALVLQLVEDGTLEAVRSAVHDFEVGRNRDGQRRAWVEQWLGLARFRQPLSPATVSRARSLERSGLKPIDALHIASAEASGCDVFLTCDDRLTRRYQGELHVLDPLSFIQRLLRNES
jgi:predicted nucleic acid-binding protein